MTDPRTTVEIALALRGAAWWPIAVDLSSAEAADVPHENPHVIRMTTESLDRIAWAASVWINSRYWRPYAGNTRWISGQGGAKFVSVEDFDPIRATLLAAEAAMKEKNDG